MESRCKYCFCKTELQDYYKTKDDKCTTKARLQRDSIKIEDHQISLCFLQANFITTLLTENNFLQIKKITSFSLFLSLLLQHFPHL